MTPKPVTLVECPRDAMQGWPVPIATEKKLAYLQLLLAVGFDTLDCLSFVSPRAVPQMADSHAVIRRLDISESSTRILAIAANMRGAEEAASYDAIHDIGYPFSISPTFQKLNANSTLDESWVRVQSMQELCVRKGKRLVVYISMGFGNPYGDVYDPEVVNVWIGRMENLGISVVSLADTVGLASPTQVAHTTAAAIQAFPKLTIGVHLHSTPAEIGPKMEAALEAGCTRFDGAVRGYGGCPMANNPLVGNMDSLLMADILAQRHQLGRINTQALQTAADFSAQVFL